MGFRLLTPRTPEEAFDLLADERDGRAVAIAGGSDLLADLDAGRVDAARVVSLRQMPWSFLRWDGPRLTVGSTLPLSEVERDARVRAELPGLFEAVHALGSLALRHRVTLGGNLGRAAPASDLIPVLLALDAEVRVVGRAGARNLLLDEFVLGSRRTALEPGELVESVTVPLARPCAYVWQRVRPANDISQVGVALAGPDPAGRWGAALGGVPPRSVRLSDAAALLQGPSPGDALIRKAAEVASHHLAPVSDKRATEAYRRLLVEVLFRRAVRSVLGVAGTSDHGPGGAGMIS